MKATQRFTLFMIAMLSMGSVLAQNCREEHTYCDRSKDKSWQISPQSKSGTFAKGDVHEISVILYDGVDYRFSFCSNKPEMEGKLEFEIFTEKTVRKYDPAKKRVGYMKERQSKYNNREDEMAQSIEFQAHGTKKVFIRIRVPDGASEGSSKRKLKASDVVCVGVLVQHQRGSKRGFADGTEVEDENKGSGFN